METAYDLNFKILNEGAEKHFFKYPLEPITCDKSKLKNQSGVYAIYVSNALTYIGSASDLSLRLNQHLKKVSEATKLQVSEVQCNYICFGNESEGHLSLEKFLIKKHNPIWNKTGFGRRPGNDTRQNKKLSDWDVKYGRNI